MDAQSRQKALDNISPEDLAKIEAHKSKDQSSYPVDEEWLLLAEFAMSFGWQAYLDAKDDKILTEEMLTLIEASRKIKKRQMFNNAQTSFIASVSARASKPVNTFKSLTKDLIKQMKADE